MREVRMPTHINNVWLFTMSIPLTQLSPRLASLVVSFHDVYPIDVTLSTTRLLRSS